MRDQLRADLIEANLARDISLDEAAESIELSRRQCRRLVELYREGGPEELINEHRDKPSNSFERRPESSGGKAHPHPCPGISLTGAWRLLNAGFGLSISKQTV